DSTMVFGFVGGACIGGLISRIGALGARIERIEERLAAAHAAPPPERTRAATAQSGALDLRRAAMVAVPPAPTQGSFDIGGSAPVPPPPPPIDRPATPVPQPPPLPEAPAAPGSDPLLRAIGWVKTWFSEGNVPVK